MRSRAAVVVAVLSVGLVTGGWLVQHGLRGRANAPNGARLYDEVRRHVAQYYVESVTDSAIYQKSLDGVLRELHDPHSVFLTPERLARLTESTTGRYGGLGVQIDVRDGWITVISPLTGGPAERAGVQTGDRIIEIDGKPTRGWTPDEASKALRGRAGSSVRLLVERPGVDAKLPFSLARRDIHVPAVRRLIMLRPGVAYVDVDIFGDSTARELRDAVDSLEGQGMHALILDLRGNPGGLLDQGVDVSDLFLDPGQPIVSMRGRTADATRTFADRAPQRWPSLPIAVLVNEGSASASEIVAGALQDHDRAVIVGRTTYGKGSAQSVFRIGGGGALKLTTARWYTPSGRSINRVPTVTDDEDDDAGDDDAGDATVDSSKAIERFKTDGGRVVYGGGGIAPDLAVGDTALAPSDRAFQQALGKHLPQFRDALTEYALSLRASHAVASRDFQVTPEMREELWRRMERHGAVIDRNVYDDAAPLVSRLLTYEIARYAFGADAEFVRRARDDEAINAALELTSGVRDRRELLARAAARQEAQRRDSAASR